MTTTKRIRQPFQPPVQRVSNNNRWFVGPESLGSLAHESVMLVAVWLFSKQKKIKKTPNLFIDVANIEPSTRPFFFFFVFSKMSCMYFPPGFPSVCRDFSGRRTRVPFAADWLRPISTHHQQAFAICVHIFSYHSLPSSYSYSYH